MGNGTEFNKIKTHLEKINSKNTTLHKGVEKKEYDRVVSNADVGLVFLNKKFTVPNFPSRLMSYMENSLPILAATDTSTDVKEILESTGSGYWCENGDINNFLKYASELSSNKILREQMGQSARNLLEKKYDIRKNVDIILKHLKGE